MMKKKIKFIKLSLRKFKDLGLEIKSSADVDDFIDRQDFFLSLFLNSKNIERELVKQKLKKTKFGPILIKGKRILKNKIGLKL